MQKKENSDFFARACFWRKVLEKMRQKEFNFPENNTIFVGLR
jgi:hypothetical protein